MCLFVSVAVWALLEHGAGTGVKTWQRKPTELAAGCADPGPLDSQGSGQCGRNDERKGLDNICHF